MSQHTSSNLTIVDLWACCHISMPLHLILETTKTAEASFFLCTSAGADVPNHSGASHDGAVHPAEVRGKHMHLQGGATR